MCAGANKEMLCARSAWQCAGRRDALCGGWNPSECAAQVRSGRKGSAALCGGAAQRARRLQEVCSAVSVQAVQ